MNEKFVNILTAMKGRRRDIFYASTLAVVILGTLIFFGWIIYFMGMQINHVVDRNDTESGNKKSIAFDLVQFALIAPRLGISFSNQTSNNVPSTSPAPSPQSEVTSPVSSPISRPLSIQVLNGTTVSGLAKEWKERFEAKGVTIAYLGNASTRNLSGMTIRYKKTLEQQLLDPLMDVFSFQNIKASLAPDEPESSEFDVTILIGN